MRPRRACRDLLVRCQEAPISTHNLKTWPQPFRAVLAGNKHHEVRRSDRDFEVGDVLVLQEWKNDLQSDELEFFLLIPESDRDDAEDPRYTGHDVFVEVTYLTKGGTYGLPEDLCVMSIKKLGSTSTKR